MPPKELQIGESYVLPAFAKFVVKASGTPTSFSMFIKGADVILSKKLNGRCVFTPHALVNTFISSYMVPAQGNLVCFNIGEIAKQYGVSDRRVYDVLRILMAEDIVRKVKVGHYLIDPDIAWNGLTNERSRAILSWNGVE